VTLEFSEWRDDVAWARRLERDQASLDARLVVDQRQALSGIAEIVGAGEPGDPLALEFMVVFGSLARGEQTTGSDLDVYFEANLSEPLNRVDEDRRYHVYGMPSGALAEELRRGSQFGQSVVADALVVHDNGSLRRLLIYVAEGHADRL